MARLIYPAAALVLALTVESVNATVITSLPGGTVVNFPAVNIDAPGPVTVVPGVTWKSDDVTAIYGYTGMDNFNTNGFWTGSFPIAEMDQDDKSMTFSFSTPVSAVGGIMDWYAISGLIRPASMAVYNSSDILIKSFELYDNSTNTNFGTPNSFNGFQESTADISSFVLSGDYAGMEDLVFSSAASCNGVSVAACSTTPLPSTWITFLIGLVGFGVVARRRKQDTALSV